MVYNLGEYLMTNTSKLDLISNTKEAIRLALIDGYGMFQKLSSF